MDHNSSKYSSTDRRSRLLPIGKLSCATAVRPYTASGSDAVDTGCSSVLYGFTGIVLFPFFNLKEVDYESEVFVTIVIVSRCKSTNFFRTGKIKVAAAGVFLRRQ
jgi:hypothetical protein